jgi:uncharacterized protein YdhG (YjbR/CyaY superfamily)
MSPKAKNADAYLAELPDDQREALQGIRETIRAAAPDAEEGFVYGVPGFKLGGKGLVCYAAFTHHCGFYPMSPDVMKAFAEELSAYDTAEGTIRFQPDAPLPSELVTKLVEARLAEMQ